MGREERVVATQGIALDAGRVRLIFRRAFFTQLVILEGYIAKGTGKVEYKSYYFTSWNAGQGLAL